MKSVIVTGGIATGKSSFCQRWLDRSPGTAFFDADRVVHQLLTSPDVVRSVVDEFGARVSCADGTVDRGRLREIVFGDDRLRKRLEEILHPAVFQHCRDALAEARACGAPLFLADIPLYYEADGFDIRADLVVVVATDADTQLRRLLDRGGLDESTAIQMIRAQIPIGEKAARADLLVWNAGSERVLANQVDLFAGRVDCC